MKQSRQDEYDRINQHIADSSSLFNRIPVSDLPLVTTLANLSAKTSQTHLLLAEIADSLADLVVAVRQLK